MSKKQDHAEALARLHEWIKPGDTVYTVLRNVSRSGMQREIGIVLLPRPDRTGTASDSPLHPNYAVATVLGYRIGKRDGIIVGGCGMDMGFHLVYNLGRTLFPEGFGCIGKECRSNDHTNGDRDYTPDGVIESRCKHCQDVPGKDGLGRPCKHCNGAGSVKVTHQHWHKDGGYALRQNWL